MSETVHVTVIKGSINTFKDGSFKKGDTFETTREEALKIDPSFIQILEDLPVAEEVLPEPPASPEPTEAIIEDAEVEAEKPSLTVAEVGEVEKAPKKRRRKASADA